MSLNKNIVKGKFKRKTVEPKKARKELERYRA
jgi:hypothetical protein